MEMATINLLEEIDSVSKIHILQRDDIDNLMVEMAKRIVLCLRIERMSVWLFNPEHTAIISMGEYDLRDHGFKKESTLKAKDFPAYFSALHENKILLAPDIYTNPITREFSEAYSKPNDIISLMDIPMRIGGELVGVMCFEQTGKKQREFTKEEQTFAFSVSLVFASNLEARARRALQSKLEDALKEKDLLIKEINHRVKNNFSILISLMRLSKHSGRTVDPKIIFEEYEQRVFSMLKVHDMLYQSKNFNGVNISEYLTELVNEFRNTHAESAKNIKADLPSFNMILDSKKALHLGLIVTEIFLNYFKYCFLKSPDCNLFITLTETKKDKLVLRMGNDNEGFDFNEKVKANTLGLPLIKDLAEGICETVSYPTLKRNYYEFEITPS
jgi:two-component sensor histidine kinase